MEKKCAECGLIKPLNEFKYSRAKKDYTPICKKCLAERTPEYKIKLKRENQKRTIKRLWTEVVKLMGAAEYDQFMYELRKIYETEKANYNPNPFHTKL